MPVTAMKMVEQKEDGTLNVTSKAEEFLPTVKGPLRVISLWGSGRTGKTYNIQQMVKAETGIDPDGVNIYDLRDDVFKVGSSLTPVTNGIDGIFVPFSETLDHKDMEGTLLFMDLEGMNNPFSPKQPIELQVLALMTTSVLVLVDRGNPTIKSVLDLARACTEVITRFMKDNARDFMELKPNWLWLLNDTDLVDTVDDPLEMLLGGQESEESVALREQLDNCFDQRGFDCLPNLHLADKYDENIKKEIDWLLGNLGTLKIGGIPIGGTEFSDLLKAAAKNINENEIVDVEPAFLAVSRTRIVEVREKSYEAYLAKCPEITKYSITLSSTLATMRSQTLADFDTKTEHIRASAGASEIHAQERATLESDIDTKNASLEELNEQTKKTGLAMCGSLTSNLGCLKKK